MYTFSDYISVARRRNWTAEQDRLVEDLKHRNTFMWHLDLPSIRQQYDFRRYGWVMDELGPIWRNYKRWYKRNIIKPLVYLPEDNG